ncbi:MAG: hypothetical protein NXI09_15850 [Bacteroidetes bacterium]|nr:hypothetical protein [Bacteroidota bacterium]
MDRESTQESTHELVVSGAWKDPYEGQSKEDYPMERESDWDRH